jgi:hypothetical protein
VGSTTLPIERIKRRARVDIRDGRPWIIYPDEINGTNVIVEMPNNAPTKSFDQSRHDVCPHRLGGPRKAV